MAFRKCRIFSYQGTLLLLFLCCLFGTGRAAFKGFNRLKVRQEKGHKTVSDEQWFIQRLDHFSADSREWKQVSIKCLSLIISKCTLKIKVVTSGARFLPTCFKQMQTCGPHVDFLGFLFPNRGTF